MPERMTQSYVRSVAAAIGSPITVAKNPCNAPNVQCIQDQPSIEATADAE